MEAAEQGSHNRDDRYEPNATLVYREDLSEELKILRIAFDSGELPAFEPGQYCELGFPELREENGKLIRRQYSIASIPRYHNYVELFVVKVVGGTFTPKLCELELGGKLWMNPKFKGKFTLNSVPEGRDLFFVSTGTGLAPFISMYRTYREASRWRKVIFIHGCRHEVDLGYRSFLESEATTRHDLIYIPTLTRQQWSAQTGRVQTIFEGDTIEKLTGSAISKEFSQFLLCGNPSMIDSVQELLEMKGFSVHSKKSPGEIHLERYW